MAEEATKCILCEAGVEAHRYLRAEPLDAIPRKDPAAPPRLATFESKPRAFYHLSHGIEAIEQDVAERYPPSPETPVRLLWSPAPKATVINDGGPAVEHRTVGRLVRDKLTGETHRERDPGLRTVIVRSADELHIGIKSLLPAGTEWFVPHSGLDPDGIKREVANLAGLDKRFVADLREVLDAAEKGA